MGGGSEVRYSRPANPDIYEMAIKLGSTTWRGGWCGYQREAFQAPDFFKGNKYLTIFNANGVKRLDRRNMNYNDNGYITVKKTLSRRAQESIYHNVGIKSELNPVNGRYLSLNGESHYSSHSTRMVQIGDDVSTRRRVDDSNWAGKHPIFVLGYVPFVGMLDIMVDAPNCEFLIEITPPCEQFYYFRNHPDVTGDHVIYRTFVKSNHRGFIRVRFPSRSTFYYKGSNTLDINRSDHAYHYFRLKSNTNAFGIQYTPWYYSAYNHDIDKGFYTLEHNYPSSGSILFMHAAYKNEGNFNLLSRMRLGEMGCKMVAEVYNYTVSSKAVKTYTHNERRVNYHSYQGNYARLNINVNSNSDCFVIVHMDEEGMALNNMRYKVAYAIY